MAEPSGPITTGAASAVKEIRHSLRWLTISVVIVALAVGATAFAGLVIGNQIHRSLCAFDRDLSSRVHQTETYLKQHPGPQPFPGVSRGALLQSLDNQKRTLRALNELSC